MKIFTLFFLLIWPVAGFSFEGEETIKKEKDKSVLFIQPEFLMGKTLPANSGFPETRLQTIYAISIGKLVYDPNKTWAVFYNYPSIGVTFSKSSFGHDDALGNAYTILPFIELNTTNKLAHSINFKLGLGASYFTEHFNKHTNPGNKAIGSRFTWTFQTFLQYNPIVTRHFLLSIGVGFIHHSNGHTQLPNLGMNSFLFNVSSKVFISPLGDDNLKKYEKPPIAKSRQFFLTARSGIGLHEFGGPDTPGEKMKGAIYSISFGGGIIFKQLIKLRAGFTYRFYDHYYNYITQIQPEAYADAPVTNASNLMVYVGCELLIGHFSIDSEIGVNIHKPFYSLHSELMEDDSQSSYWLKKTFASRLGIKFYVVNTSKNPKNNFFIGAHINANMGQADFSSLNIGYVHRFNKIANMRYPSSY